MLDGFLDIKLSFINSLDFSNDYKIMAPGNLRNKLLRNCRILSAEVMPGGKFGNSLLPNCRRSGPELKPAPHIFLK